MNEANHLRPEVKIEDIINVGRHTCIVSQVYENGDIEIVYINTTNRATVEDAQWREGKWVFKSEFGGGYADNYDRTKRFVALIRRHS